MAIFAYPYVRTAWLKSRSGAELERHLESRPEDGEARLELAERRLNQGDPAGAEEVILPLMQQGTPPLRGWILLARAQLDQGKPAEAFATLQVSRTALGPSADAHWLLGLLLLRRGEDREAEKEFLQAVKLDPEHPGAHLELARSALAHRHYGPALEHLSVAAKKQPEEAELHELISLTHRNLGDLERAEASAREAVKLSPDRWQSRQALAEALQARGSEAATTEAETHYREVIRLQPELSDPHYQLGRILASRSRWKEAAEELETALRIHPLNRQPYPLLIQAHLRLGDRRRAGQVEKQYEKVNQMDLSTAPLEYSIYAMPNNASIRIDLAELYLKYGRPDLAREQIDAALKINPGYGRALKLKQRAGSTR